MPGGLLHRRSYDAVPGGKDAVLPEARKGSPWRTTSSQARVSGDPGQKEGLQTKEKETDPEGNGGKLEKATCSECGGRLIFDQSRAELYCAVCFVVAADAIVLPERGYHVDEDQPFDLEKDEKIYPQIRFGYKDPSGKPVQSGLLWTLKRTARTYNLRPEERSILAMQGRIRRFAAQLGLPRPIVARALYIYRWTKSNKIVKKPGLDDWALAVLRVACRDSGYVITDEDLVAVRPHTKISEQEISELADEIARGRPEGIPRERAETIAKKRITDKTARKAKSKIVGYYNKICRAMNTPSKRWTVEEYIIYFSGKMRLPASVFGEATRIYRVLRGQCEDNDCFHTQDNEHLTANSTPHCVAAAALYIIATQTQRNRLSQREFSRYVGMSEISLRKWVKVMGGISKERMPVPDVDISRITDVPSRPKSDDKNTKGKKNPHKARKNPPPP
jgi:transcription initiation factor TFIIIB Brf1 subunit/transcription initiation factor TFIIB